MAHTVDDAAAPSCCSCATAARSARLRYISLMRVDFSRAMLACGCRNCFKEAVKTSTINEKVYLAQRVLRFQQIPRTSLIVHVGSYLQPLEFFAGMAEIRFVGFCFLSR